MNITTTYKTKTNGSGVIEARSGDRRKTVPYDHERSVSENHGIAAGEFIIAKAPETASSVVFLLDKGMVEHFEVAPGKHKFVF